MDVPRAVAVALLTSGGSVFLERRPEVGPLPGLWQFPGGKVEFGEHPWDALRRELKEERGLRIERGSLFGIYSHVYDLGGNEAHYLLIAYRVRGGRARLEEGEDARWFSRLDLRRLPVVPGSKPIVADLLHRSRRVT